MRYVFLQLVESYSTQLLQSCSDLYSICQQQLDQYSPQEIYSLTVESSNEFYTILYIVLCCLSAPLQDSTLIQQLFQIITFYEQHCIFTTNSILNNIEYSLIFPFLYANTSLNDLLPSFDSSNYPSIRSQYQTNHIRSLQSVTKKEDDVASGMLLLYYLSVYQNESIFTLLSDLYSFIYRGFMTQNETLNQLTYKTLKSIIRFSSQLILTMPLDSNYESYRQRIKQVYEQQWTIFCSIYDTLDNYAFHLIESIWKSIYTLDEYDMIDKEKQITIHSIPSSCLFLYQTKYMNCLYFKGITHSNPQISYYILQYLLDHYEPEESFLLNTILSTLNNAFYYKGQYYGLGPRIPAFIYRYSQKVQNPSFLSNYFYSVMKYSSSQIPFRYLLSVFDPIFLPSTHDQDYEYASQIEGEKELYTQLNATDQSTSFSTLSLKNVSMPREVLELMVKLVSNSFMISILPSNRLRIEKGLLNCLLQCSMDLQADDCFTVCTFFVPHSIAESILSAMS